MKTLLPQHGAPLPIDGELGRIVDCLRHERALVLTASPGTGKTTRVPPALLAAEGLIAGKLVLLEPRRIAARAAARRIAEEWGWKVGQEIGYRIRFDRRESPGTRLLIVTEGVLVRMLQGDPFLQGIDCLIFDEIHERSLDSDLALAMARRVQVDARPDLRIVAMSATLDPGPLAHYLGDCPHLEMATRAHPVRTSYLEKPLSHELSQALVPAVRDLLAETSGNILIFLPGMAEIRRAKEALLSLARREGIDLLALHGSLPAAQQDAVLTPSNVRKVVLSTNVAETSLTVPGVTAVIDSGLAKILRHDHAVGLDRLETSHIAKANADQRTGRAGRQSPGACLRLWTASEQLGRPERPRPEISRIDLSGAVLQLLDWGEKDLDRFPFFERPSSEQLDRAVSLLELLGLVNESGVTTLGHRVARLPLSPRLGRLVAETHTLGDPALGSLAAALLAEVDPFRRSRSLSRVPPTFSDLQARLDALRELSGSRGGLETPYGRLDSGSARRIHLASQQVLERLRRTFEPPPPGRMNEEEILGRSLLAAFPDRLARLRSENSDQARLVGGRGARLLSTTGVRSQTLFIALDLDAGRRGQGAEARIRMASGIEEAWLPPGPMIESAELDWDDESQRVRGYRIRSWRGLTLAKSEVSTTRSEATEAVLIEAARARLDSALGLDEEELATFLKRVQCLRAWMPELSLPALDEHQIADLLPILASGRRSFEELRRAPLIDILRGLFSSEQRSQFELNAPETIRVPSGSRIRLQYEVGRPPVLAVRIQELFGLDTTPTVAAGRVKVLLHLLAPNFRPQQVTDDLRGFWQRTYPEVRKELRGRYPKHPWPEDPSSASPRRRSRRR